METYSNYWDVSKRLLKIQRQLPAIEHIEGKKEFPLSSAQKRLWFTNQLDPGITAYNMVSPYRLLGGLDIAALKNSFRALINRHDILRISIINEKGQPRQVVNPPECLDFRYIDLKSLPVANQDDEVKRLISQESVTPFDISKAPLFRVLLLKKADAEFFLITIFHHIISDGWSAGIFYKELEQFYNSFINQEEPALPELKIQYTDYALWEQRVLEGEIVREQLSYWKEKLATVAETTEFPTDFPRPPVKTFNGSLLYFEVPEDLTSKVRDFSKKNDGMTIFMILLSVLKVIVYRYTGQENICIGSTVANRNRNELRALIGFFVNTVALNTDVAGNPTFNELLDRVRGTCLEAYANQDVAFERVVRATRVVPERSRNALFQIMFTFQNVAIKDLKFDGIQTSRFPTQHHGSMFDLTLALADTGKKFYGYLEYNTDLFTAETVGRIAKQFLNVLEKVIADCKLHINEIPLLLEEEYHRIVYEWNQTEKPYAKEKCIHHLFEEAVKRNPAHTALICGGKSLTYEALNQKANQLARYLLQTVDRNDSFVGVLLERSLETVIALLAILKAGFAYMPIDPAYPDERIAFMVNDVAVSLVVTEERLKEKLPDSLSKICLDADWTGVAAEDGANLKTRITSSAKAYTIFTSGSTGNPKGVVVAHRSVINLIEWVNNTFKVSPTDQLLFINSLCFDLSVYDIFGFLAAGGTINIATEEDVREPQQLLNLICTNPITIWHSAPAAFSQTLPFMNKYLDNSNLTRLRLVLLGGDWIPVTLPDAIRAIFKNARVISVGGPTEATVWSNYYPIEKVDPKWVSIPYGKPIQNAKCYILDDNLHPCPIGVPGNLYLGGDCLGIGYANRPELTAARFVPDVFSKNGADRMYYTGDRARFRADGNMEFMGRNDKQVKIRGFRIELEEIETVLGKLPKLQSAVVAALGKTNGEKQLIAYYTAADGAMIASNEIRLFLKRALPEYMVPSYFVALDSIPLTLNGKIDYAKLPDLQQIHQRVASGDALALTAVEKKIADVWTNVLGVSNIGKYDNFFRLGGHSLNAIQIVSEIEEQFGIGLTVKDFFRANDLCELAVIVEDALHHIVKETRFDLRDEVALPLEVNAAGKEAVKQDQFAKVFLTGATGFFGAHLLEQLLTRSGAFVCCLVRGSDEEKALLRIKRVMEEYGIWQECYKDRIRPVTGDISRERMGLSQEVYDELAETVDVVYHSGAWVNFFYPYATLKANNVVGTQKVLEFVTYKRVKILHYISTLSAVVIPLDQPAKIFYEDSELPYSEGLYCDDGYAQSKWVAEKIVEIAKERGAPVNIYRLGNVSGHTGSGICNTKDFIWLLVGCCMDMGCAPYFYREMDLTPVDYMSKAVYHLSRQTSLIGKKFNLYNANSITWVEMINLLNSFGYEIKVMDYSKWRQKLIEFIGADENNPFAVILHIFGDEVPTTENSVTLDYQNAKRGLRDAALQCPPVDCALVGLYLNYFIKEGLYKKPHKDSAKVNLPCASNIVM
jgi:amino acid adenylation domain-containing protein/thioester reductase-like protein